jgi:catechol 2,3-dioxygenase-like lactoylglutathione lyase family enzyme
MPEIIGFSHVDLTVTNCERSADWWAEVLGFTLVHQVRGESFECKAMAHPSGVGVTVMTHDRTAKSDTFDERRVGLDHLAFRVADQAELQRWVAHLDAKGVTNTGIIDTGYGPTIVFRDPDNMQLEFYVQPTEVALTDADSEEARRVLEQANAALTNKA